MNPLKFLSQIITKSIDFVDDLQDFKAINNHQNLIKSIDFVMICNDYSIPPIKYFVLSVYAKNL